MQRELRLFADYHQIHLTDDDPQYADFSSAWSEESVARALAVIPHGLAVGTARDMEVPVTVVFCNAHPAIDRGDFDRLNEAEIEIATGRLVVMGCTDYLPDAARLACEPGKYSALIGYKNLESLSEDGLEGDDSYHVWLWPKT